MTGTKQHAAVGGLVARFQGQRLHAGWMGLIDQVRERHDAVFIALGDHGGIRTGHDPLTYKEREHMVREAYPQSSITIARILDNPISPEWWSEDLDALTEKHFPGKSVQFYGSRKSFIPQYSGRFPTESITPTVKYSGTELRAEAQMATSEAGRAAIINSLHTGFNRVFSTVDIAVIRKNHVLLINKDPWRHFWAFPGGYCDPESESDLDDAAREAREELPGITFGHFTCITPYRVKMNDPRYRDSGDRVRSSLLVTPYVKGETAGGDDAQRAKWVHRDALSESLVPWHQPLNERLQKNWPKF